VPVRPGAAPDWAGRSAVAAAQPPGAERDRPGAVLELGPGAFHAATGRLRRLGDLEVDGPRLDVWRAPTDNDVGMHGETQLDAAWRRHGLHRTWHRVIALDAADGGLVVRTRVGSAAWDSGLLATYTWTPEGDGLRLALEVAPEGEWPFPLPRLGLRLAAPQSLERVEWFGRGPGEAYSDTRQAARVGRFSATIEELQTPYVRPQENGNRLETRWATFVDGRGNGLRVEGRPHFAFAARRWTSEDLDAAGHTPDLAPRDRVWVNIDHAQQGIGTASCGPGVLPQHRLHAAPTTFAVVLREQRG
jgi:beta-galactosidase